MTEQTNYLILNRDYPTANMEIDTHNTACTAKASLIGRPVQFSYSFSGERAHENR